MDERPFPHGPLPQPPPSRRGFLAVGALTAVAAGGGVWLALSSDGASHTDEPPAVLHQLRAAAAAEQELLARVDAAARRVQGSRGQALRLVRADHVAHLAAISASIAELLYPAAPSAAVSRAPSPAGPSAARVSVAEVRTAERAAANVAAARAARMTGDPAALFASIAAAEASHAELLR